MVKTKPVFITLFVLLSAVIANAQNNEANGEVKITPIKIIRKVQPRYTDKARKERVEGVVRLKVEFCADSSIGTVTYNNTAAKDLLNEDKLLTTGLVDEAIKAAKLIKFISATRDGVPVTVLKTLEYVFTL